jgi:hypothetical protein
MKTSHDNRVLSVRITNKKAVELINDRAIREHRSASNAGALTVIEALDKDIPGSPGPSRKKGSGI